MRELAVVAGLVALFGCGGQPGPHFPATTAPNDPGQPSLTGTSGAGTHAWAQPGEGLWQGTIHSRALQASERLLGMGDGWGSVILVAAAGEYYGTFNRSGPSPHNGEFSTTLVGFASRGRRWPDGSLLGRFQLMGSIDPPSEINSWGGRQRVQLRLEDAAPATAGI